MRDAHYPLPRGRAPFRKNTSSRCLAWAALLLLAGCPSTGGPAAGPGSEAFGLGDEGYREPTALAAVSNEVLMRAIGLVGHILEETKQPMALELWERTEDEASAHLRPKK